MTTLKRADAEEMLALWGHEDLDELPDYHIYNWMEEIGYCWTGWSWVMDEGEVVKPKSKTDADKSPRKSAKQKRADELDRLAKWTGRSVLPDGKVAS